MVDIVRIERLGPGLWSIAPPGSATMGESDPGLHTAVLEVGGGYLSWSVLAEQRVPTAALHDLGRAHEWLWVVYGARVAVAIDEYAGPVELPVRPERPGLAAAVRRLGYAHWAASWWPASTVDGIPALDPALLAAEIAELSALCEHIVDGADAPHDPLDAAAADPALAPAETLGRADEYALAAGGDPAGAPAGLVFDRGSGGWDWRHCPPGLVDASEHAVSWEVMRVSGGNTLLVRVVAAPDMHGEPPAHLRPRALVRTPAGTHDLPLALTGDTWTGGAAGVGESVSEVAVYVPGVGPSAPEEAASRSGTSPATALSPLDPPRTGEPEGGARQRDRIRELAHARLRLARATMADLPDDSESPGALADIAPLRAEITAARSDSDF